MSIRFAGGSVTCILGCVLFAAQAYAAGLVWRVESKAGESGIRAALTASRKHPGKPRQIVLGPGRYYIEKTIVLDPQDAGLTVEGAGPGKTIVYGGRSVTGWRKDGDLFWAADVPEVKTGEWDFRALVVNDHFCPRARLPEKGYFEHESRFPVRWMSSAGGGWERKPTKKELTTLKYRDGDLGPWLNVRNAEVTVYHMWDESLVGVAAIDPATHTLTFSSPCTHPPGAFGVHKYVVWNVREGMKHPGQWYLDRTAGRIVYWPLPGEDMTKALVVAPCAERIFDLHGLKEKPLRNVIFGGMTLSATTTPCKPGGFGAYNYRGALDLAHCENVQIQNLEVVNVAGYAIWEWGSRDLRIENCHLHHLGAGGCRVGGGTGVIENCNIHHIGLTAPSAIGLAVLGGDSRYVVRRNIVHDTPYSAMAINGDGAIVEENLIYRCMRELHDGAAIYVSGAKGAIIRRNVARDIVEVGKGYGAEAYYLDEKCRNCVIEKNVAIGVRRPTLNHMTLSCTLRDNVFVSDGDMELSFSRSSGYVVTGNIFHVRGEFSVRDPDAIAKWTDNLIVRMAESGPSISEQMPRPPFKPRKSPRYARVTAMAKPPVIDGELGGDEWPPGGVGLSDRPDQHRARGAPVMAKYAADATHLFIGLSVVCMFPEDRKLGHVWGRDEGVEIAVEGKGPDGKPVTYVLRGFADGTLQSLTVGGASPAQAKAFRQAVNFAAKVDKKVWHCEWAIPFSALRFVPKAGAVLPLNVTVYRSEDRQFIQWAGTLGETWDLKFGGRLVFGKKK